MTIFQNTESLKVHAGDVMKVQHVRSSNTTPFMSEIAIEIVLWAESESLSVEMDFCS